MAIVSKIRLGVLVIISHLVIVGCGSNVQKADIPSSANPEVEISKFDQLLQQAVSKNVDVLAEKDYKSAAKMRDEAKSDLASGQKQDEILDDVRIGRGHLSKAEEKAESRQGKASGVLEARIAALVAGAGIRPELQKDLKSVDSDVSDASEEFEKVSVENLAKMQKQYVDLERRAVVLNQLGDSQAMVNGAKDDGAAKKAPQSLKKAEVSLKTAESQISTNVRNASGYESAVRDANLDSVTLREVMLTISQNKNLSEPAALKMVSQNNQIQKLETNMSKTVSANAANEAAMSERNDRLRNDLKTKDQQLSTAQGSVEMQMALEKARSQFTTDEAEAYQQGGNLLIRLKKMNFASGRSDLPEASLAVLAKVSEVAKSVNASEIKVEGHTDSTGTEAQNMAISEKRASAVAAYFKTNGFNSIDVQSSGFGFQKPIATNKSKDGRAQNRRVDIVITPEKTE